MPTIEQIQTPTSRRWSLRLAVTAGVLLLFALGAVPGRAAVPTTHRGSSSTSPPLRRGPGRSTVWGPYPTPPRTW